MAYFLEPNELKKAVKNLFAEAETEIYIVSPFIKLDDEIKAVLEQKISDPDFHVFVLFGKNEDDKSKSLNQNDIEFFKQFQNVEIKYNEDLHAKYYANESASIITSLNLHSFSLKNNIEVGLLLERKRSGAILSKINSGLAKDYVTDCDAFDFFLGLIKHSKSVFQKHNEKKKSFFGLKVNYTESIVETDRTEEIMQSKTSNSNYSHQSSSQQQYVSKMGYCIRTGKEIPFSIEKPMCFESFRTWSQFGNPDYEEHYCHFSGEPSNGQTTISKPILNKYWKKAKETHNF